jgi:hypothetical protein
LGEKNGKEIREKERKRDRKEEGKGIGEKNRKRDK